MTVASKDVTGTKSPQLVRRNFLGMDMVDAENLDGVVLALEQKAWRTDKDRLPLVVTPNVDIVVQLETLADKAVARHFSDAWCVLPDGQPLVMLGRRCGVPFRARLAGSSLVEQLWPILSTREERVLVIAATDETATALRAENESCVVVVPPMFDGNDQAQIDAVCSSAISAMQGMLADYVFVGISFPKSHKLIDALLEAWPQADEAPVFLGIGASFEMYLGNRRRAPQWVQDRGLEWLYRFAQEPKRLFHRYFIRDSRFFLIAARALRQSRSNKD